MTIEKHTFGDGSMAIIDVRSDCPTGKNGFIVKGGVITHHLCNVSAEFFKAVDVAIQVYSPTKVENGFAKRREESQRAKDFDWNGEKWTMTSLDNMTVKQLKQEPGMRHDSKLLRELNKHVLEPDLSWQEKLANRWNSPANPLSK